MTHISKLPASDLVAPSPAKGRVGVRLAVAKELLSVTIPPIPTVPHDCGGKERRIIDLSVNHLVTRSESGAGVSQLFNTQ